MVPAGSPTWRLFIPDTLSSQRGKRGADGPEETLWTEGLVECADRTEGKQPRRYSVSLSCTSNTGSITALSGELNGLTVKWQRAVQPLAGWAGRAAEFYVPFPFTKLALNQRAKRHHWFKGLKEGLKETPLSVVSHFLSRNSPLTQEQNVTIGSKVLRKPH